MARTHYKNEVVRLADLTVTTDILTGITFEDCLILGPGVILPLDETRIENCTFMGTAEAMYWHVPSDRGEVLGGIGLSNCVLLGCRLERIGFGGPIELFHALKGDADVAHN